MNKIINILFEEKSISKMRAIVFCTNIQKPYIYSNSLCAVKERIKLNFDKKNKILAFLDTTDNIYIIKTLEFDGYDIDFKNMEDAGKINFDEYNIIITPSFSHKSTYIKDFENRKNEVKIIDGKLVNPQKELLSPCMYIYNPKKPKIAPEKNYPYMVQCGLRSAFLNKHNLEMFGAAGVIGSSEEDRKNYYLFYKNNNLPVYWLKKN